MATVKSLAAVAVTVAASVACSSYDDPYLRSLGQYNLLFLNKVTGESFPVIRRGRGPGEINHGCSLHSIDNDAAYYDSDNAVCMRIRLKESIMLRSAVADTIVIFDLRLKPIYLASCAGGAVSCNIMDSFSWYSFYYTFIPEDL